MIQNENSPTHFPLLRFPQIKVDTPPPFYVDTRRKHDVELNSLKSQLHRWIDSHTEEKDRSDLRLQLKGLGKTCFTRYLKANEWKVEAAFEGLKDTLLWRRSFFPISPTHVYPECITGKNYLNGFDKSGHPILFLKPRNENTKDPERQVQYLVFILEAAARLMPFVEWEEQEEEGTEMNTHEQQQGKNMVARSGRIEQMVLILDFRGMSLRNQPSLSTSRKVIDILNRHYPERLYKAFILHAPGFFSTFWKLVSPFLHPVTRDKIRFVAQSDSTLPDSQHPLFSILPKPLLEREYNGQFHFEFKPDVYWEELLQRLTEEYQSNIDHWGILET